MNIQLLPIFCPTKKSVSHLYSFIITRRSRFVFVFLLALFMNNNFIAQNQVSTSKKNTATIKMKPDSNKVDPTVAFVNDEPSQSNSIVDLIRRINLNFASFSCEKIDSFTLEIKSVDKTFPVQLLQNYDAKCFKSWFREGASVNDNLIEKLKTFSQEI